MNSGPTSERAYDTLRTRLLTRVYSPGQRLDPAVLAHDLSTSITPVRDALHLLTGRGLVDTGTGEGFHVRHLDAPALSDLYGWNLDVLTLALRSWPRARPDADTDRADADALAHDPLSRTAILFAAIGQRSPNAEHLAAIELLNDRLQPIRIAEGAVIGDPDSEVRAMTAVLEQHESRALHRLLVHYHRRRQRKAAEIVRSHYRR